MNASLTLLALCSIGALGACTGNALEGPPSNAAHRVDTSVTTGPACVASGEICNFSGSTCCAGFCLYTGYTSGICVAPEPDGASCYSDAQCETGRCEDYACGARAVCRATGARCQTNADCCAGGFCDNFTYAAPTCKPTLSDGDYCYTDAQCAHLHCRSYVCTAS